MPITVAVFHVAITHRARVAVAVAAVNIATVPLFYALHTDPKFSIWVDFALRGAFLAAAVGWGSAVRAQRQLVRSLRDRAAQLDQALTTSRQISTAVGILMAPRKITDEEAFALLKTTSQHLNRKLYMVAEEVSRTGTLPGPER